jgi:Big-like domain-containing protein
MTLEVRRVEHVRIAVNLFKRLTELSMRVARLSLLLAGLATVACHSSTSPTTTTTPETTTTTTFTLAISGSPTLTGLRQRSQMSAIITNADGTTQDVTNSSIWQSSDSSVAVITANGVVTTIAPGSVHVSAAYQTENQGFDINVVPETTTFTGVLQSSDGRNGTFTLVVHSATDPTSNTISSQVTGTLQIQGSTIDVTGFFESLTGAITFQGVEVPYRFDGTVSNGALTATFTGPNNVTGAIASGAETVTAG